MRTEMTEQEKRLFDVSMRYVDRFGDDQLLPLMELPPEMADPEFQIELYERCLVEGVPAGTLVPVKSDPAAIY
jgi:hypothetical protein